ncbi:MAG: DegV family EDD domain-containing protein [Lachnospiraceae bacterium]|nr:DegV family EDD domain-containing protein [Lachnospiraceae bacterium]
MAFQLFTDSDCDMTPETCAEYGYKLISMPYTIEGQLVRPYEDFDKFDAKTFYDTLRSGILPSTSAISEQNYIDYFEPVLKEGKDILYVHFSAAMSNTFDFMNQAIKTLQVKYPERKFYLIDTKGITTISLLIALEVGDLAKAGKTAEEIMEWAETEVDHFAMYFTVDDLKFFHKSGRVSGLSAVMGTLIGIRPIIYMNPEG